MQFEQSVLSPFGLVGQSGRQRLTGLNVIAFLARWVALAATTFVHAVTAQWYVVNALCRCTMRAPCILSTLPKEVPNRTRLWLFLLSKVPVEVTAANAVPQSLHAVAGSVPRGRGGGAARVSSM